MKRRVLVGLFLRDMSYCYQQVSDLEVKLLFTSVCEADSIDQSAIWHCKDTALKSNSLHDGMELCFKREFETWIDAQCGRNNTGDTPCDLLVTTQQVNKY